MQSNSDLLKSIETSRKNLTELLTLATPDDAQISGVLNFVRSKFLTLIIRDTNESLNAAIASSENELKPAQAEKPKAETAECLIDQVWSEFYHPVFRYYQAQHQALKDGQGQKRQLVVELRKVNDRFKKLAKQSRDFYFDLLKNVLTQHKIDFVIPHYFYQIFNFQLDPNAIKVNRNDNVSIVKLIYLAQRCILYVGATSRYRSLLSRFLSARDHESFDFAIEMYLNAELLLPAFGDTRNLLGVVYNDQDMKFSALYEFSRASLARIPSKLGVENYNKILESYTPIIEKLNRYRLDEKCQKKKRFDKVSVYFFVLFGYYSLPSVWKRSDGYLINGTKVSSVEKDMFDIFTEMAHEGFENIFFEKIFSLLIGAIKLNNTSKSVTSDLNNLLKFTFRFITYLQAVFVELWYVEEDKSLRLLPLFRLVYSWLKVDKLALQYSNRSFDFLKLSALTSNLLFNKYKDQEFLHRPHRAQYFMEDVSIREFIPLDRLLHDFNDTVLFSGEGSSSKLIGKFKDHDFAEESKLRAVAIGSIVKQLLETNQIGIVFNEDTKEFDLSNVKQPIKKVKEPKAKVAMKPIKTNREVKEMKQAALEKKKKKKRTGAQQEGKNGIKSIQDSTQKDVNSNRIDSNIKSSQETKQEKKDGLDAEQVYPKRNASSSSSSSGSSIQLTQNPNEQDLRKLDINDSSPRQQSVEPVRKVAVNAEDLEAKLIGNNGRNSTIVDSLVTNTFSSNSRNIWESAQPNSIWGNENSMYSSPIPHFTPPPFQSISNVYAAPAPNAGYSQFPPALRIPQFPASQYPDQHQQQSLYLQYLNQYQTTSQQTVSQNRQSYEYGHYEIQVPGTQSPYQNQNIGQQNQNQNQF